MKTIAFVLIATFAGFQLCHGSIGKAKVDQAMKDCLKINGLTETFLNEVLTSLESKTDPNYDKLTKYLVCMYRTLGVFEGPNDDINKEKLGEYFGVRRSETKVNELVEVCNKKKSTPEETAMGLLTCELFAGH